MSFAFLLMSTLWISLVVVLLLFIAYLRKEPVRATLEPEASYQQVVPLTDAEQVLYWRLVEALPECVVLPQVSFSRFIRPETNGKAPLPQYRALQERIAQKTIDYLVCLRDFTAVAAIELHDKRHVRPQEEKADELLAKAGIKVIRLRAADLPSVEQLRTRFTHDYEGLSVDDRPRRSV